MQPFIKVYFSKKMGLPNYGSLCGACEISFQADDADSAADQLRKAQGLAERAVQEQLEQHLAAAAAGEVPEERPSAPPPDRRPASYPAQPSPLPPTRSEGRVFEDETPRSGSQLCAWALKQKQAGRPEIERSLKSFGRQHGLPWKWIEWPSAAVLDAVNFAIGEYARRN